MNDGNDCETATCEHCGTTFDRGEVPTTVIPSTTLFRCPACSRWTE